MGYAAPLAQRCALHEWLQSDLGTSIVYTVLAASGGII